MYSFEHAQHTHTNIQTNGGYTLYVWMLAKARADLFIAALLS